MALLLPSTHLVNPDDEHTVIAHIALALTDSAVNSAWRRYSLLWVMTGIMALYAAYSITAVSYNTCLLYTSPSPRDRSLWRVAAWGLKK